MLIKKEKIELPKSFLGKRKFTRLTLVWDANDDLNSILSFLENRIKHPLILPNDTRVLDFHPSPPSIENLEIFLSNHPAQRFYIPYPKATVWQLMSLFLFPELGMNARPIAYIVGQGYVIDPIITIQPAVIVINRNKIVTLLQEHFLAKKLSVDPAFDREISARAVHGIWWRAMKDYNRSFTNAFEDAKMRKRVIELLTELKRTLED